jgi:Zn finger protein HypA/HybF involved in hydrogenase expression
MPESSPPELKALKKFNCKACGAEAVWTPAKQTLVCPYCGTVSDAAIKADASGIEENDLMAALQALPQEVRGWQVSKKTVRCQSCQAISVFDPQRMAQNCDFCGSPALIDVQDLESPVRPEAVLPFIVPDTTVRESIRRWYSSHWFAPNALGDKALTDTLHGIYLPYWTFDAQVHAQWQAESGEIYVVRDSQGNARQQVRWSASSGEAQHAFDDLLVPASRGVHPRLLEAVSPFPTTDSLVPYDPGYVSGWVVEQYQIDLRAAASASYRRMEETLHAVCAQQVPGDTHRNLEVATSYSGQTFKHVLLPVWLLTYNYGTSTYQVVVNGVTGQIEGEYPVSWIKVMLVVIGFMILLSLFMGM